MRTEDVESGREDPGHSPSLQEAWFPRWVRSCPALHQARLWGKGLPVLGRPTPSPTPWPRQSQISEDVGPSVLKLGCSGSTRLCGYPWLLAGPWGQRSFQGRVCTDSSSDLPRRP